MKLSSYYILCTVQKNLEQFHQHYLNMETIFINTENSKTNESNKFIHQFTDKLNLRSSINKSIGWLI